MADDGRGDDDSLDDDSLDDERLAESGSDPIDSDDNGPEDDAPADGGQQRSALAANKPLNGWLVALVVTALSTVAMYGAYAPERAGQSSVVLIAGGCYALLTAVTFWVLKRRNELNRAFKPWSGDITIGALSAAVLYMVAFVGSGVLMPSSSPRNAWLMRVYLQIGDPQLVSAVVLGGSVFLVAALEEIVWRGLVMRALADEMSKGRAVLLSSVLYALAHITTIWQLRIPSVGYNPLLVAAALGCGLAWGTMAWRFDRLLPSIVTHALFSWAIVEFPLWHL